jgi:hypothetical protein
MFSRIRRRLTYVNVVATLALLFAMSGGALAAGHYLITSTKQIRPSVLKSLQGKAGAKGATGATGAAGPQGPAGALGKEGQQGKNGENGKEGAPGQNGDNGKEGSPWTAGGTLPAGKTLKGQWVNVFYDASGATSVSFALPLATAPAVHWIKEDGLEATASGEEPSTVCLGTAPEPTAASGNLCVYTTAEEDLSTNTFLNNILFGWKWGMSVCAWSEAQCTADTATPFGFDMEAYSGRSSAGEEAIARGTWAVTAAE